MTNSLISISRGYFEGASADHIGVAIFLILVRMTPLEWGSPVPVRMINLLVFTVMVPLKGGSSDPGE